MNSSANQPSIISLGEVLWDLFPEGARFGGAPANFACHAAALGGEVTMISAVRDDLRGHEAVAILRKYGIHTGLIQISANAPTGTVGIKLDDDGKPSFTIHEGSAWDPLAWMPELETRVEQADAVYFGTLGQRGALSRDTIRRTLDVAKKAGIQRVLDVNLRTPFFDDSMIRESIEQANVLKLSDDELATVCAASDIPRSEPPEALLRRLLQQYHLDLVVLTRGAQGALLVTPDQTIDQPGIPVIVCDTVGAGDSFTAALVLGLLRNDHYDKILNDACTLAAEVCATPGAVPRPSPAQFQPEAI
jgi:fructokinase